MMEKAVGAPDLVGRVEALSERVEALADPEARMLAQDLVGAVIDMYGRGLERIVAALEDAGDAGASIFDEISQDGAVASLLLIHDLYPVDLETRVVEALDTVRPYMESHGGNVDLLGIEDGVAHLRLQGSCSGCAASQATLELAIKQALDEHAPDLVGLEVEGVVEPPARPASGVELPMMQNGGAAAELPVLQNGGSAAELPLVQVSPPPAWLSLEGVDGMEPGSLRSLKARGTALVVANVDGCLLAYRDACAACGASLQDGVLDGRFLRCESCGMEFDLPRAGRAAGNEPLQLEPVPLLDEGGVRVAV
jgi:Fe-S cluster biogenesis protein NfuA/nitrite reductase/ring-hydroxylating ferredoxin subunit